MLFNVNNSINVKLTELGYKILKEDHDNFYKSIGRTKEYVPPKEDSNGRVRFQMWDFMNTFGDYCSLGSLLPFDPEIEIIERNYND